MNLEFLDIGLPLEAGNFETTSKEIAKFREYCELLGKKPEQLTQEELQKMVDKLDNNTYLNWGNSMKRIIRENEKD